MSLLLACGAVACGSDVATATGSASAAAAASAVGSGTAKGSVQSQTLTPMSAASAPFVSDGNFLLLALSNQADYCGATAAGQTHANHRSLVAIFTSVGADGSNGVVGPGTFVVQSTAPTAAGSFANAVFNASDASCSSLITGDNGTATSGTIVLTSVTATAASGTYSLMFGSDALTGTFSAPTCAALAAQAASGASLTCVK